MQDYSDPGRTLSSWSSTDVPGAPRGPPDHQFNFDAFLHDSDGIDGGFDPNAGVFDPGANGSKTAAVPAGKAVSLGPDQSDYEMQLQLVEQQNKKRLMMARAAQSGTIEVAGAADSSSYSHGASGSMGQGILPGLRRGPPMAPPHLDVQPAKAPVRCLGPRKGPTGSSAAPPAPRRLDIHRVVDEHGGSPRLYLDPPRWIEGDDWALVGNLPISNVRAYLAKYPEVCFIRCRRYRSSKAVDPLDRDGTGNLNVSHESESVIPVEQALASAISKFTAFVDGKPEAVLNTSNNNKVHDFSNDWLNEDNSNIILYSPYRAFYHIKGDVMDDFTKRLNGLERAVFRRVSDYIKGACRAQFAAIDALVSKGKITNAYLPFLFQPGMCIVQGKGKDARGYMCSSWLQESSKAPVAPRATKSWGLEYSVAAFDEETQLTKSNAVKSYTIDAWYWDLDPSFVKKEVVLKIDRVAIHDYSEKTINDMDIRPLAQVDQETSEKLQDRGEWFWKCRKSQMVAYHEDTDKTMDQAANHRYMIDMAIYHELHPLKAVGGYRRPESTQNTIGSEAMACPDPPDATFVYLAPLSVRGFNLKTKKWSDLSLDGFAEVTWNTDAFANLVLDVKTKRLIQALISNQIEAELSTDIISGKGNGLIMLLHGGPGTGKTLTAESVAEIAQRPLYPVTCGDIGTEPGAVEKYLESVLSLGKAWGCVVLLDEADVFLEQRSLEDLHRNALVSVFLRVLEYYDGILVLTSNRVGTFDEAFKSRIQLAVHYASLTVHQRTEIWGNFLGRLKRLDEEGIDFPDLEGHVAELARHRMNGREIRNVITTARQFARWERKQQGGAGYLLNYKVMEEIIETSGKFDQYIEKLNGGMTNDELAEDEGLRLANDA
ncbi:hypothetical protein PG988_011709 [Apiospora saccharicola]